MRHLVIPGTEICILLFCSLCYNYHYAVSEYELTHYDITGNLFPPSLLPPWRPRVNWLLLHSSAPCRDGPGSGKRAAVIKRLICEESNRERERERGRLALEDRKGILDITHNIHLPSHEIENPIILNLLNLDHANTFPNSAICSRFLVEVSRSKY